MPVGGAGRLAGLGEVGLAGVGVLAALGAFAGGLGVGFGVLAGFDEVVPDCGLAGRAFLGVFGFLGAAVGVLAGVAPGSGGLAVAPAGCVVPAGPFGSGWAAAGLGGAALGVPRGAAEGVDVPPVVGSGFVLAGSGLGEGLLDGSGFGLLGRIRQPAEGSVGLSIRVCAGLGFVDGSGGSSGGGVVAAAGAARAAPADVITNSGVLWLSAGSVVDGWAGCWESLVGSAVLGEVLPSGTLLGVGLLVALGWAVMADLPGCVADWVPDVGA